MHSHHYAGLPWIEFNERGMAYCNHLPHLQAGRILSLFPPRLWASVLTFAPLGRSFSGALILDPLSGSGHSLIILGFVDFFFFLLSFFGSVARLFPCPFSRFFFFFISWLYLSQPGNAPAERTYISTCVQLISGVYWIFCFQIFLALTSFPLVC